MGKTTNAQTTVPAAQEPDFLDGFQTLMAVTTNEGREDSLKAGQAKMLADNPGSVACPICIPKPANVYIEVPTAPESTIRCWGFIKAEGLKYMRVNSAGKRFIACPRTNAHTAVKYEAVRRGWYQAEALGLPATANIEQSSVAEDTEHDPLAWLR